jgi:DNA-binding NarL/FixJ family response regulator
MRSVTSAASPARPTRRLRVLLADAHPNVRGALRADLEDAGFDVCAEAADGDAAAAAASRERPDVCLVDASIPGGLALVVGRITAESPAPKVVVLSVSRDEEALVAAFRAGAVGYLPKDVHALRLGAVVDAVANGATLLPRSLAPRVHGS